MAYICTKNGRCDGCDHFRYDKDEGRMACFAQQDIQEQPAAQRKERA